MMQQNPLTPDNGEQVVCQIIQRTSSSPRLLMHCGGGTYCYLLYVFPRTSLLKDNCGNV